MRMMKRTISLLAMAAMLFGFAIPVAAASDYAVAINGKTITFTQDGKAAGTYTAGASAVSVTSDRDKDMLVQFTSTAGKATAVSLGKQKALTISGTIDSLTINSSLLTDIVLTIPKDTKIGQMVVYGNNTIAMNGTVTALTMNAGNLTVGRDAVVSNARLTNEKATLNAIGEVTALEAKSTATITGKGVKAQYKLTSNTVLTTTDKVGTVAKAPTVKAPTIKAPATKAPATLKPTATPKPAATKPGSSTGTKTPKLRITLMDADSDDKLRDRTEDLNNLVRAYDPTTGEEIYGTCSWVSSSSTVLKNTDYYRFKFVADESGYKDVTDRIKIRVDGDNDVNTSGTPGSSDRRIKLDITTIKYPASEDAGLTLRDMISYLESNVEASSPSEDIDLTGVLKWSNPDTKVEDGKSYKFTFDPDDTDYKMTSDKIKIYFTK